MSHHSIRIYLFAAAGLFGAMSPLFKGTAPGGSSIGDPTQIGSLY
jgi:hypothetical protein